MQVGVNLAKFSKEKTKKLGNCDETG
jgi:hypothetical protein